MDDNKINALALKLMLECKYGLRSDEAVDGKEGVQKGVDSLRR